MITTVTADGSAEYRQIASMRQRAAAQNESISRTAAEIMEDVRLRGMDAVRE